MNKPKLNQQNVETTTTTCTSCNKYPLKNYKLDQPDVYQYALNNIVKSCCPNCHDNNGCLNCNIKESCNATAKYWVDRLQDLIDIHSQSDPTIEEVKKEWEDDGWEWIEGNSIIDLKHKKYKYFIRLNLLTKTYGCYFIKNIGQESSFGSGRKIYELCSHTITLKEHIRLTKTFRALKREV